MEILASIQCSDKRIDIQLKTLLDFEYFNKMFNNFNTKIEYTKEVIRQNNNNVTIYQYRIPELSINCSSKVLKTLLKCECDIYSFNEKEFLLELLFYAGVCQMPFQIHFRNELTPEEHILFMKHVKDEMPHINAFALAKNGGFDWHENLTKYAFKFMSNNDLDILGKDLAYDLIEFIELHMRGANVSKWNEFDLDAMLNAVCSIKHLYALYPEQIKKIINTQIVKDSIKHCACSCNYDATLYYCNFNRLNKFNTHIDKLFNEYRILEQLNLICINEIGSMDDYKKTTYICCTNKYCLNKKKV